jgi:hypothetical protein
MALLLLAPSPAGEEQLDCGLVPGERYWVTRGGKLVGDDIVVEDATNCIIPEGAILSVFWDERPPTARLVVHAACTPTADEEAKVARMVQQARKFVRDNGFSDDSVVVEQAACASPRRLDVVVE